MCTVLLPSGDNPIAVNKYIIYIYIYIISYHFKENSARRYHKCVFVFFMWKFFLKTTSVFSTYFRKIFKSQISWKSVPWRTKIFFHAERTDVQTNIQTAMTKLTVALRNFANAPQNREIEAILLDERNCSVFAYVTV